MAFGDTYVERGRIGSIVGRLVCYEVICSFLYDVMVGKVGNYLLEGYGTYLRSYL